MSFDLDIDSEMLVSTGKQLCVGGSASVAINLLAKAMVCDGGRRGEEFKVFFQGELGFV